MNYKILGDSDCPVLHIQLKNQESIKIERGCMAYLSNVACTWTQYDKWRKLFYHLCDRFK